MPALYMYAVYGMTAWPYDQSKYLCLASVDNVSYLTMPYAGLAVFHIDITSAYPCRLFLFVCVCMSPCLCLSVIALLAAITPHIFSASSPRVILCHHQLCFLSRGILVLDLSPCELLVLYPTQWMAWTAPFTRVEVWACCKFGFEDFSCLEDS